MSEEKHRGAHTVPVAALCMFLTAAFTLSASITPAMGGETGGNVYARNVSSESGHDSHEPSIPGESARHITKVLKHAVDIGLTETQQKAVGDIYIKAKAGEAAIKAEIEVTINDYMSLYRLNRITESAIDDYAKKMGDLRGKLLQNNLKAMNDVKNVLNSEQRGKLHEIYKTHGKGGKK